MRGTASLKTGVTREREREREKYGADSFHSDRQVISFAAGASRRGNFRDACKPLSGAGYRKFLISFVPDKPSTGFSSPQQNSCKVLSDREADFLMVFSRAIRIVAITIQSFLSNAPG